MGASLCNNTATSLYLPLSSPLPPSHRPLSARKLVGHPHSPHVALTTDTVSFFFSSGPSDSGSYVHRRMVSFLSDFFPMHFLVFLRSFTWVAIRSPVKEQLYLFFFNFHFALIPSIQKTDAYIPTHASYRSLINHFFTYRYLYTIHTIRLISPSFFRYSFSSTFSFHGVFHMSQLPPICSNDHAPSYCFRIGP